MTAELSFDLRLPEEETLAAGNREVRSWQEKLPGLLRILGAGILLVTMYSFLVDGWRSGNDSLRYLMMLGHTGALAAIGLASLRWLNEAKGTRLLLSLALVAVPANFAILGALGLSLVAGVDPSGYPQYVAWQASSLTGVGLLTLGAAALLIPLTLFGFRVLARSAWSGLSCLFLANNALLLLPVREGQAIAAMAFAGLLANLWLTRGILRGRQVASTREGMWALALPVLPLAILMGRSLWLYRMDFFLAAAACLTAWFFLRQITAWLEPESRVRWLLELVSVLPALGIAVPLAGIVEAWNVQELILPLAGLGSAAMFYDLAQRATAPPLYRWFAAFMVLSTQGVSLLICDTVLSAAVMALSGLVVVALAFRQKQRSLLLSGAILVAGALMHQLCTLIFRFELGSWLGLGMLGVLAIVTASVLESRGSRLAALVSDRRQQLSTWQR